MRVRDFSYSAPEIRLRDVFFPIAEIFAVEGGELRRHPRFRVNAIGHMRDRHFGRWHAAPNILPKRAADIAVQFADAIRVPAHAQGEDGHAKRIGAIDARLPEGKQFVKRNLELFRELAEIFPHHVARE